MFYVKSFFVPALGALKLKYMYIYFKSPCVKNPFCLLHYWKGISLNVGMALWSFESNFYTAQSSFIGTIFS